MNTEGNNQDNNPSTFKDLDKKHKIALFVLIAVAVAIFTFWILKFNKVIESPFVYQGEAPEEQKTNNNIQAQEPQETEQELMNKDTDGDGLTDWDEINIYGTSRYLEDTDSDGISDYEEVVEGTNPNCAEGEICNENNLDIENQKISTSTTMNELQTSQDLDLSDQDEETLNQMLQGQLPVSQLREVLKSAGFPSDQLDQLTDKELENLYKEAFSNSTQ